MIEWMRLVKIVEEKRKKKRGLTETSFHENLQL